MFRSIVLICALLLLAACGPSADVTSTAHGSLLDTTTTIVTTSTATATVAPATTATTTSTPEVADDWIQVDLALEPQGANMGSIRDALARLGALAPEAEFVLTPGEDVIEITIWGPGVAALDVGVIGLALSDASLTFRQVLASAEGQSVDAFADVDVSEAMTDPVLGLSVDDDPLQHVVLGTADGSLVFLLAPAFITDDDIVAAEAQDAGGYWVVDPTFRPEGDDRFLAATAEISLFPAFGNDPGAGSRRRLAVVVDGVVMSSPTLSEALAPGEGLDPELMVIATEGEFAARALAFALSPDVPAIPVELLGVTVID